MQSEQELVTLGRYDEPAAAIKLTRDGTKLLGETGGGVVRAWTAATESDLKSPGGNPTRTAPD